MHLPARAEALPAITRRVVSGIQFYASTKNSIYGFAHDPLKLMFSGIGRKKNLPTATSNKA